MPLICYTEKNFRAGTLAIIDTANDIIEEFRSAGYDLTLRQLYYQFVARGLLANKQREYKRLGSIINDARLAGLIDWNSIVDRTRNVRRNAHWDSPQEIIESCAQQFQFDKWAEQGMRPEVWIEKDALVGVIEGVCRELDVPHFSCRGYTSQSEMWSAAQRLRGYQQSGQTPVILHLGDHDPSGLDMTRDIFDRLDLFVDSVHPVQVLRLALNYDQVEEYDPPPNPAKLTDSRAEEYIRDHGDESWELDALTPQVITTLIRDAIVGVRDDDLWAEAVEREEDARARLHTVAERWEELEL